MAYVTGGSLVGASILALPAGLMLLLIGFSSGRSQLLDTLLFAGYELCLLALLASSIVALVRLPSGERRWGALVASVVVMVGYSGLVLWLVEGRRLVVPYDRQASIRQHNDDAARKTVTGIAECARRYAQSHPGKGYPASLAEIERCTGNHVASRDTPRAVAPADGYVFFYVSDPPSDRGISRRFALCARPVDPDVSGTLVLGVNPGGAASERRTVPRTEPNCFETWAGGSDRDYLQALSACVMSIASLSPQRGYPQWLAWRGEEADRALTCGFAVLGGANGRIVTARGVFEYRPELPDAQGRTSRYVIYFFPSSAAGGALSIDETGTIREGLFPGVAPTLESIEAALPYERIKAERIAARRATLTRECQGGDLDVCDALGDFELEHHEPLAAQDWWERACERGRLLSCLFTGRYSPQLDTFAAHNAKERCVRGEPRYCEQLREMVDSQRAEIEKLRASGGRPSARVRGSLAPPTGRPQ